MTGYLRGDLTTPDGIAELLATAEESLAVAERLDCPRLNLHGTGLDGKGLPVRPVEVVTPPMWLTAADTLRRVAELGERAGGCSRWRTSTWPSTTPARRSRAPPTRWRWPGPWTARTCGSTSTSTTPRSARGTSSSSSARRCRTSARSRWPTCRAAASRAPARSTTRRSPRRSTAAGYTGVVGLEAWAQGDPDAALDAFEAAFSAQ